MVDDLASVLARAHGHLQNARAHAHLARVQVQVDAGRRREVEWLREQPHALATKAATLLADAPLEDGAAGRVGSEHESAAADAAHDHIVDTLPHAERLLPPGANK